MTNFQISVVSDTVCPWCFVGKKKLDKGIALYRAAHPDTKDTFTTTWLPYYLNPSAPKTGIDKLHFYKSKFGDQKAAMIFERLTAVGKEVGISFRFGGKTGNTRDSHRLIQLAKTKGPEVETRVVEELFKSYFEQEGDITDHEELGKAAVLAGLDGAEVKRWLASDEGGAEVDREVGEARVRGVSGVPNFVLQGKYEVGGAQDPETFVGIFENVKGMEGS